MRTDPNDTLGDIVAADYRKAAIFERFGMDFCCGGRKTVREVCDECAVDMAELLSALDREPAGAPVQTEPSAEWPLDKLIEHIVTRHHAYVRNAIPVIEVHTAKIAEVHGQRSPELRLVVQHFARLADELTRHMIKEEEILFPYVRSLAEAARVGRRIAPSPFGTVHNPIRMMEMEHEEAGDQLRLIREVTHNYVLPDFACATYRACFQELQEFERDLHLHVHLENNILFPEAIKLEERLS